MHWQTNTTQLFLSLTPEQQSWLTDTQSLTKRLRKFTDNQIKFHVLHNTWSDADKISRELLELKSNEKTWVRHIEFRYDSMLWISAIVVMPEGPLTKKDAKLIGTRPIGETLFQKPELTTRESFTFCQLNDGQFARRSLLCYGKDLLLITETFTREFFKIISPAPSSIPSSRL